MDVDFNGILMDVFSENVMNIGKVCGLQWVEYIHGWDTQRECLASKSLSRHYFEKPLHLQINFFGNFFLQSIHILVN